MALNILAASVAKLAPRAYRHSECRGYLAQAVTYTKVNGKKEQQLTITLIVPASLAKRVARSFETRHFNHLTVSAMKRNFSQSIAGIANRTPDGTADLID